MHGDSFRFEVFHDNTIFLRFDLRKYNSKTPWDVSSAGQISLECTNPNGDTIEPVLADPLEDDADWANGIVMVKVEPGNVTGVVGTWQACLTVVIGGETKTADEGTIECLPRPGYPPPP